LKKNQEIQGISDEELLRAYAATRDSKVLGQLLERYIRFVLLVCMRYVRNKDDARDISMHVFEKVTNEVHRFEIQNFKSWLHVVAKNQCLVYLRSRKGRVDISLDTQINESFFMENDQFVHPVYEHEHENRIGKLEEAMKNLDQEHKICIELFFMQEKSYKEIADITGFSMNQVKSYIQNGKRNLKNRMAEKGDLLLYLFICLQLIR
jgi:RNA polymerase sigma factor (sigma-70 family)